MTFILQHNTVNIFLFVINQSIKPAFLVLPSLIERECFVGRIMSLSIYVVGFYYLIKIL